MSAKVRPVAGEFKPAIAVNVLRDNEVQRADSRNVLRDKGICAGSKL
ncbi:hypothetical protein [Hoeflea poritis]|uniref:Transposase n=1 Tax=Hoeflea poritis TaxID=2993659 RepID=A0ABT4VPH7_9HYPH|nr:hypothetical protein [Hoeflea poritis]MDA4846618.1 hypothetical protein [Hoeflea poritis]